MYESVVSTLSLIRKLWIDSIPMLVWLKVRVAEVTVAAGAVAYTGLATSAAAASVSAMMEVDPYTAPIRKADPGEVAVDEIVIA